MEELDQPRETSILLSEEANVLDQSAQEHVPLVAVAVPLPIDAVTLG